MKRRWPREVGFYQFGFSPWLDDERKHRLLHQWTSKEKRRTHKRERREGRAQAAEQR